MRSQKGMFSPIKGLKSYDELRSSLEYDMTYFDSSVDLANIL